MKELVREKLAINADQTDVAALLEAVTYSRPEISTFLEAVGPDVAFQFSAWYLGLLMAQEPKIINSFKDALNVGIQTAGVMLAQHAKENPNFTPPTDAFLILYPGMVDPKQLPLEVIPAVGGIQ